MKSQIIFGNDKLANAFKQLQNNSEEKQLLSSLVKTFEALEQNAFFGTQIPKKLIPKEYTENYSCDNLWKVNLQGAWRLLYTVKSNQSIVLSIVLEWLPHKKYERKFKY